MLKFGPSKAGKNTKGQILWHAYFGGEILRDKAGIGRRFKSSAAAEKAVDAEVTRRAKLDPDAQPLTAADFKRMKRRK